MCWSLWFEGSRGGLGISSAIPLLVACLSLLCLIKSLLLGQQLSLVRCDLVVAFPLAVVEGELGIDAAN